MKIILVLVALTCVLLPLNQAAYAQATDTCSGYTAVGDPFPCCSNGNCTWWAWKMMHDNWGTSEPDWHDAHLWASNASASGNHVISIPSPGTIAVNTTASSGLGHVAYVTQVNNDGSVYVSEMNCGGVGVNFNKLYSAGFFDAGYIYPLIFDGTPSISSTTPGSIVHSASSQNVTFNGSNPGHITAVYVNYPGGHSILTGSGQILSQNSSSFTLAMTLGITGNYSVQAVNNNGTTSNTYSFFVQ